MSSTTPVGSFDISRQGCLLQSQHPVMIDSSICLGFALNFHQLSAHVAPALLAQEQKILQQRALLCGFKINSQKVMHNNAPFHCWLENW